MEDGRPAEGCLVAFVRVPARVFALLVVVPLRFAWEAALVVLRPAGRVLAAAGRWADGAVRGLALLLYRRLLRPVGLAVARSCRRAVELLRGCLRAAGRALGWAWRTLVVAPARWFGRRVLRPFGVLLVAAARGFGAAVAWLAAVLLVRPARCLHRGWSCRWAGCWRSCCAGWRRGRARSAGCWSSCR
ncbi:hypothetical protein GCM10025734_31730 [Kitasatospora paranensis]|uniref:hypothetical protein n=1 Tax=Kitasatospora paranensis TaxID=258053 RepID=UPI0031F1965C